MRVNRFRDQDYGDTEDACAQLALALYDKKGAFVEREDLFGKYRSKDYKYSAENDEKYANGPWRWLTSENDPIVSKFEPGFVYKMEYKLGKSDEEESYATDWSCMIFPAEASGIDQWSTVKDQEGAQGSFLGPINDAGKAEGVGLLVYDNYSGVLVAQYTNGTMKEGIFYALPYSGMLFGTGKQGEWLGEITPDQKNKYRLKIYQKVTEVVPR